jgi:AraC-like DNA-binding protein
MDILYLFCMLTLGQGVFLAIYLLTSQKKPVLGVRLLSLIVLIEVFTLYDEVILFFADNNLSIHLYYIGTPMLAAVGPLALGYVYFSVKPHASLKARYLLHFIPAVLAIAFAIANYHLLPFDEKQDYLSYFQDQLSLNESRTLPELLINTIFRVYLLAYLIAGWLYLSKSEEMLKSRISKGFMRYFLAGFIGIVTLTFLMELLSTSTYVELRFTLYLVVFSTHIFGLAFIYFRPPKRLIEADKYQKSGLSEDEATRVREQLKVMLKEEEVFKNPLLTLQKLAHRLDTNNHYLSQIINTTYQQSFNELINDYRINEAKVLLQNDSADLPIEEIAAASGFASPSSFFRIFKKHTGKTPSQFKADTN